MKNEELRIGVYTCHCGTHNAGVVPLRKSLNSPQDCRHRDMLKALAGLKNLRP